MAQYEVIVAGLGAYGSAALYHLAKAGIGALGIDCFAPPHEMGSSHGETRITRLAIGEGAHLTPIVRRSHELWRQIEEQSGESLLVKTGGLFISSDRRTSDVHVANFFANTLAAARTHHVAHEVLDAAAIRTRFPQFAVRDDETGYFEPEAGYVRPEACVAALLKLAAKAGAAIRTGEVVEGWEAHAGGVRVRTDHGSYTAKRLVLAGGAWNPALLGAQFSPLFRVLRQVLHWFAIEDDAARFTAPRMPVFIWELQTGTQGIYGFPSLDGMTLKVASEEMQAVTTADTVDRLVHQGEGALAARDYIAPHIPGLSAQPVKSSVCLYTMTPDAGFIIDTHPDCENVLIVSACSGHGFKHSAALGEGIAQWGKDGRLPEGYQAFAIARFRN